MVGTTRRMLSVMGLVGIYVCLCAGWSHGQVSDKPKAALLQQPSKNPSAKIDVHSLIYPYYEWVAKDYALAWVENPNGSVCAMPLTGEHRDTINISGASNIAEMGSNRPCSMKVSPDGNKILFLMDARGTSASTWRVGTLRMSALEGLGYSTGRLLFPTARNLVWKRNSKGWVSIVGHYPAISAVHYNIDGLTPPLFIPIKDFKPTLDGGEEGYPDLLGIRPDGIAIVPVDDGYDAKAVNIYMVDLDKGLVLPEKHRVVLPIGAHIRERSLSHSGERIAWLFEIDMDLVKRGELTHEVFSEVWLSNADGSDLKRLSGFTPIVLAGEEQGPQNNPEIVRWTLDDTAISYIQEDILHLVNIK